MDSQLLLSQPGFYSDEFFETWNEKSRNNLKNIMAVLDNIGVTQHLKLHSLEGKSSVNKNVYAEWVLVDKPTFKTIELRSEDPNDTLKVLELPNNSVLMCSVEKLEHPFGGHSIFSEHTAEILSHSFNTYLPTEDLKNSILSPEEKLIYFILTCSFTEFYINGEQRYLLPTPRFNVYAKNVIAAAMNQKVSLAQTHIVLTLAIENKWNKVTIDDMIEAPLEWLFQFFPESFKLETKGFDIMMRHLGRSVK